MNIYIPGITKKKPKKEKRPTLYAVRWKQEPSFYVHWKGEDNKFVLRDEINGAATFTKENALMIVQAEEDKELESVKAYALKYQL